MNTKAKARKRQRDRARGKEKKSAKESKSSPDKEVIKTENEITIKKPEIESNSTGKNFLTSDEGEAFETLLRDHYKGFVHIPADKLIPSDFHLQAKKAFERLRDANYYHYDIVMAGGKHSSRTFVKRTLVGDPGITYKYLGLRLFAHPWSGPGSLPMMKSIFDINKRMVEMTRRYPNHALCDYNLTLINYMQPKSHNNVGFKEEAVYGMGKVSVSWHADSSLKENSSIGVFHCLPSQRAAPWDWRIALRPSPEGGDSGKDVLPVAVSTADGDAYFLLGNFNKNYQHCVLAGSSAHRISSTHRVAITEHETFQYIVKRVKNALKRFRLEFEKTELSDMDVRVIIFCQKVLTECEMEWIAQYWLQGAQHDEFRTWWQKPMKTLEALWSSLEEYTFRLYQSCMQKSSAVPRAAVEALLEELKIRREERKFWDERRNDKIYQKRVSEQFRPVARPIFYSSKAQLGKDLGSAISGLTKLLNARKPALAETAKSCGDEDKSKSSEKQKTSEVQSLETERKRLIAANANGPKRKKQKTRRNLNQSKKKK